MSQEPPAASGGSTPPEDPFDSGQRTDSSATPVPAGAGQREPAVGGSGSAPPSGYGGYPAAPGGYPAQAGYGPPPVRPGRGLAITALVIGIVAVVLGWVPVLGILLGIAAIVLGVLALRRKHTGFGVTALVLGALALLTSLFTTFVVGSVFSSLSTANEGAPAVSATGGPLSSPSSSTALGADPSAIGMSSVSEPALSPAPTATDGPSTVGGSGGTSGPSIATSGTFSDGTFAVGTDVAPGLYEAPGGEGCYWERAKDASGDTDSTIANDLQATAGPAVAQILKTDAIFETNDCGTWAPVSRTSGGAKATTFGDGEYLVGRDIQPGTYRAPGGEGCYWERSKDAAGSLDGTIANDLPKGSALVTISASDFLFKTNDCGTWTRR